MRVFDSVARGDTRHDSDIDLLVTLEEGCSLLDGAGLMQDLEDRLGRKVDVVNARSLHWHIQDHVLAETVPMQDAAIARFGRQLI